MLKAVRQLWLAARGSAAFASLCAAVAAVAVVVGVAAAVQKMADLHLAAEAERVALDWARHLGRAVPDIDLLFLGELPSPQAQDRLTAMRGMAGLFQFKLYDPQGSLRVVSDSVGTPPRPQDNDPASGSQARLVAQGGKLASDLRQGNKPPLPTVYSRAFVPVRHGTQTIGVIEVLVDQSELASTTGRYFRHAALLAGAAMALCIGAAAALLRRRAVDERKAHDRATFLSEHDALTGALNHRDFSRRVEQACKAARLAQAGQGGQAERTGLTGRTGQTALTGLTGLTGQSSGLAVICIDLDGFADINTRYGHPVGDELLRRTAERLQNVLRGADLLARLAGDRFAVLQHGAADSASVAALVQRIVSGLGEPHDLPGLDEAVLISVGVGAALQGVDGNDAGTLLHNAELALLRAKASGRGAWSFYDASLDLRLQERRALANDLRQAIAQRWLRLHYQPVYGAAGGRLIGYEALARWSHPTRGSVAPMEFIPVAEETGQIQALGRWVLDAACTEAATWPAPLSVAVNLSAAQFRDKASGQTIVAEVRAALRSSGLAPERLELEITESLLMNHTEQVLATLHALRALGVRIAMDDFGTGYSSLAYLWRFPFDKLKIDRAFTQGLCSDPRVAVIVRSIVTMAHSLSIRVNAEGVETVAQRDALCQHGCDELQGYLLGRPAPSDLLVHREAELAATTASAFGLLAESKHAVRCVV